MRMIQDDWDLLAATAALMSSGRSWAWWCAGISCRWSSGPFP